MNSNEYILLNNYRPLFVKCHSLIAHDRLLQGQEWPLQTHE